MDHIHKFTNSVQNKNIAKLWDPTKNVTVIFILHFLRIF